MKADALLFAVVADVDAYGTLLLDNIFDGTLDLPSQEAWIKDLTAFLTEKKIRQHSVTRQTSDVSHKYSLFADLHEVELQLDGVVS